MSPRALWLFLGVTFAITWGIAAALLAFPEQLTALFGELSYTNPLYILATWAPAVAAFALVWRHHGLRGIGSFVRRLTLWRMAGPWWVFLLLGIPGLYYLGAAIAGTITDPFPYSPWYTVLPAMAIMLTLGPVEEFGWRGVALPLLQRRFTPLTAGVLVGAVWGVWHLPAFFLGGTPHADWAFAAFFIGVVGLSVLMTAMFNAARGSLLIPVLFHFQINLPAWPESAPWGMLLFAAAAAVVVVVNPSALLSRERAATHILMPADEAAADAKR